MADERGDDLLVPWAAVGEHDRFEERVHPGGSRDHLDLRVCEHQSTTSTCPASRRGSVVRGCPGRGNVVYLDILDADRRIALDIDLPEIEDMPAKVAAVTGRGFEIKFNEMLRQGPAALHAPRPCRGIPGRRRGDGVAGAGLQTELPTSSRRAPAGARPETAITFLRTTGRRVNRRGPCWICMGRARMGDRSPGAPPR